MRDDQLLLLSGPPFAGKGENSKRWAETFNAPILGTGDGCRSLKTDAKKSDELVKLEKDVRRWLSNLLNSESAETLLKRAIARMDAGKYVDDDFVVQMVYGFLTEKKYGMLEGFPRNPTQAVLLDGFLETIGIGRANATMFLLEVREDEQEKRIKNALETGCRCRPDDTLETIRERIALDAVMRQPVEAYYRSSGRLRSIDANGTPDEVFGKICDEAAELGIVPLLPPDPATLKSAGLESLFQVKRGGLLTATARA